MTWVSPQPPQHSRYRQAALEKAVSVLIERGVTPDARYSIPVYWEAWMQKIGLNMDIYSFHWFWRDVIHSLILVSAVRRINTGHIEHLIQENILTREPFQMGKQSDLHPVRFLKAFFSKKELRSATNILGTVLAAIAIRADIAKQEYPTWYPYLWIAWSWLDSAATQLKLPENSIEEISTLSIYKEDDKIIVNGVKYNHVEAMALASKLSFMLRQDQNADDRK